MKVCTGHPAPITPIRQVAVAATLAHCVLAQAAVLAHPGGKLPHQTFLLMEMATETVVAMVPLLATVDATRLMATETETEMATEMAVPLLAMEDATPAASTPTAIQQPPIPPILV